MISTKPEVARLTWLTIIVTQFMFALAELCVLREVAEAAFLLPINEAVTFTLGVALVAYLYVLRGGYNAVYVTDVVQVLLSFLMCFSLGSAALYLVLTDGPSLSNADPGTNPWALNLTIFGAAEGLATFAIAFVVGMVFLLASPDTWKRVYVAARRDRSTSTLFFKLLGATWLPFILLVPVILIFPEPDSLGATFLTFLRDLADNQYLSLSLVLGLTASSLSSLDSAMLATTHLSLVEGIQSNGYSLREFHWKCGGIFLALSLLFIGVTLSVPNPYAPGMLIAGPYALIGGLYCGTGGFSHPTRHTILLWLLAALLLLWFQFALTRPFFFHRPDPSHLWLGPVGAGLFFVTLAVAFASSSKRTRPRRGRND